MTMHSALLPLVGQKHAWRAPSVSLIPFNPPVTLKIAFREIRGRLEIYYLDGFTVQRSVPETHDGPHAR